MIPSLSLLPPELFPTDMQPLVYFTILPTIIGLLIFLIVLTYVFILPPEAKLYLWNRFKKDPMIDYETDEGVRKLETMKSKSEGVNYGMKTGNTYLTPRPISNELLLSVITPDLEALERELKKTGKKDEKGKKIDYTDDEIKMLIDQKAYEEIRKVREMERAVLRPSIVAGLGVPIYRCYQSKAIATTLAHLIGLEYSGDSKSTQIAIPLVAKTGKRLEAVELNLGKDKKTGEWIVNAMLPVDPNVIKKWFKYMWTQSQIKASNRISEEIGRDKEQGFWKRAILIVAAIAIIMAIFFVAVIVGTG